MNVKPFIPSVPEIGREALIVIFGAIAAAVVLQYLPELKAWIVARLPSQSAPGF